jgi:hypothetical protein
VTRDRQEFHERIRFYNIERPARKRVRELSRKNLIPTPRLPGDMLTANTILRVATKVVRQK